MYDHGFVAKLHEGLGESECLNLKSQLVDDSRNRGVLLAVGVPGTHKRAEASAEATDKNESYKALSIPTFPEIWYAWQLSDDIPFMVAMLRL